MQKLSAFRIYCVSALSWLSGYLLEIQNSTLSIIVGVWFFVYPDIYNTPTETFRFMTFAPSFIWGTIYAVFGVVHLLALFTGFRRIRKEVMLIKSGLWAFLAITVLSANIYSVLGWFAVVFTVMTFTTFLRVQILTSQKI